MKPIILSPILCVLLLTGCESGAVKDTLGIGRRSPDEFRVVSRPPLSVPPQFNLRPPSLTEESPNALSADQQAQSLVTGKAPTAGAGETFVLKSGDADTAVKPVEIKESGPKAGSSAESQFLQNAGAASADPTVRTTLVEEKLTVQEQEEEKSWWEKWTTFPDKKETTVDAQKEAERVKKNQDEGKPVTEGETPVAKPKDRGILGRILGD